MKNQLNFGAHLDSGVDRMEQYWQSQVWENKRVRVESPNEHNSKRDKRAAHDSLE